MALLSIQLVLAKERLMVMLPIGTGLVGSRTSSKVCLEEGEAEERER